MDARRISRRKRYLIGAIIALLAALACNEHGLIPIDEAITVERQDFTTQLATNKVDILWIVDNSNSMCQEQDALTANFNAFIEGIVDINADFRLAVVTTDMATDNGRFQSGPGVITPGCAQQEPPACEATTGPVLASAEYLTNPADPQSGLDVARLQHDFACIASAGTAGSGFEKGLDSMAAALSPEMLETINAGFRREDAWLAIIFVADENDCSDGNALDLNDSFDCEALRDDLIPVDVFVEFVRNLPGTDDGERILVAGIIGPDNNVRPTNRNDLRPSCTSVERGDAYAGYRYQQFVDAFGDRGVTANICNDSFQVALDEIARVIRENLAVKCLREQPRTCGVLGSAEGCAPGTTCVDPDTTDDGGLYVCSNFVLAVESRADGVEEWSTMPGPETADPTYLVHYNAASCPTGIGVEFTPGNEPGAGVEFRIRYPITIGGGGTSDGTGSSSPQ